MSQGQGRGEASSDQAKSVPSSNVSTYKTQVICDGCGLYFITPCTKIYALFHVCVSHSPRSQLNYVAYLNCSVVVFTSDSRMSAMFPRASASTLELCLEFLIELYLEFIIDLISCRVPLPPETFDVMITTLMAAPRKKRSSAKTEGPESNESSSPVRRLDSLTAREVVVVLGTFGVQQQYTPEEGVVEELLQRLQGRQVYGHV